MKAALNCRAVITCALAALLMAAQAFGQIQPATGEVRLSETDWQDHGPHPLTVTRHYRSQVVDAAQPSQAWRHSWDITLSTTDVSAVVSLGDGSKVLFSRPSPTATWIADDPLDSLSEAAPGPQLWRGSDETQWQFDATGKLLSMTQRNGWTYTLAYSGAQLQQVTNAFGRSVQFAYSADRLSSVTPPDGLLVGYGYDGSGRLNLVSYPDGSQRTFVYENAAHAAGITGVFNEAGVRIHTFAYDANRRATSSSGPGGVQAYTYSYSALPGGGWVSGGPAINPVWYQMSVSVTDPRGNVKQLQWQGGGAQLQAAWSSNPADGINQKAFTAANLPASETDPSGVQTTFTWDAARRLKLSTTEAVGRPEQRTRTTEWHPTLRLPVLQTEPGRTIATTYDAVGNKLTESITDTATGQARNWAWSYTANGLVDTYTDARGGVWRYGYDAAGNRTSVRNPLEHETAYTYDAAGRVLTQTEPSGLVTSYSYDPRGRLLSQSRGGETIAYSYDPTGTLANVGLPSGLSFKYVYDNAQRLIGWYDSRGGRGAYTLDAAGNRTVEQVLDGAGAVAWQLARTIGQYNQLLSQTVGVGGAAQPESFGYNANVDLISRANGLSQATAYGLDGLKRVTTVANPDGAAAKLAYNALDAVTAATDFKGAQTAYTRNAFGDAVQEASGDAGTRVTDYGDLGLPTQLRDAMNQATTIDRDRMGRPTSMRWADGRVTFLRYDMAGDDYNAPGSPTASLGYLSEIEDRAGLTRWQRDAWGRVTRKTQVLANGATQTVQYAYTASGLLDTVTYPGGAVLQHLYDGSGRLSEMTWAGQPLVSNITWNPLGQPTGWTWSLVAPVQATRAYDTAGRVTATELGSLTYNAAGRITALTQNLGRPANTDPLSTSVSFAVRNFTVGYDAVGRITSFADGSSTTAFTYDANGNRLSSTQVQGSTTTVRTYSVDPAGNKLLGFTQQISGPGGNSSATVAYTYNANGELTANGLAQYGFDPENRLTSVATGNTETSPTTRYAHNALGQRLFKTEPVYAALQEQPADPGFWQSLLNFFSQFWNPAGQQSEQLGFAYVYDEDGTLIGEYGSGGAQSVGSSQYIWLPTPNGPLPVAAIINGNRYAVHADHLNTPRRLTNDSGIPVWQWKYSAFGHEQPTQAANRFVNPEVTPGMGTGPAAAVAFNLRYPGQYADQESGLHYNYFRSYSPNTGRYSQPDPIGLQGGWNRFTYVGGNPFSYVDSNGLILETLWDIGNLAYDIWNGNWEDAAWDAAAMCIPGVPAGMTKIKNLPFPKGGPPRDPKTGNYLPHPDAVGPHTTLGTRQGRNGEYTQGATFDGKGNFTGRTDVTNHGRGDHTNPHFHPATGPNGVGPAQ